MSEELSYKLISGGDENGGKSSTGATKKRNDRSNLKERLSKIVSIYIPNDDAEKVLLRFNEDVENEGQNHHQMQERRSTRLLQSLDDGLSYEVELLCGLRGVLGRDAGRVKCACVIGGNGVDGLLLMAFEGEGQIVRLRLGDGVTCESVWLPKVHGLSLLPWEMRAQGQHVYVSGTVAMGADGSDDPDNNDRQWIIVKYDLHETVVASTRRYSHHRFGSFDLDQDGNLLLLSPQLEEHSTVSQISKLTGSFESRRYHINLGDGDQSVYCPLYVAAHGPGGQAWVTVTKGSRRDTSDEDEEEHRLMCFHCCVDSTQATIDGKEGLRTALEPRRWRMAGHQLGPIVSLGNHALALDDRLHTLCVISWDHTHGHPLVRRISASGAPTLLHLCSDGNREAFLFTEQSIFLFKLQEQLIKDSEILV